MVREKILKILKRYGLEASGTRDISLLGSSCVALGYTQYLKEYFGSFYKAVGGIGGKDHWIFLANGKDVAHGAQEFIRANKNSISNILDKSKKIFKELKEEIRITEKTFSRDPINLLRTISDIYPKYIGVLGVYNVFNRYLIHYERDNKISKNLIKRIGRERNDIAYLYPHIEDLLKKISSGLHKEDFVRFMTLSEVRNFIKTRSISSSLRRNILKRKEGYLHLYITKERKEFVFPGSNWNAELDAFYTPFAQIKKEDYVEVVKRPYPPLWSSLIIGGQHDKTAYKSFFRESYSEEALIIDDIWYFTVFGHNRARELILWEWNKKSVWTAVIKLFKKREKTLLKAINKDFKELSQAYKNYMPALNLIYLSESPVLNKLQKKLVSKIGEKEARLILDTLQIPLQDNFYKKEEIDLVKTKNIRDHVKKYEWLPSRYGINRPYTVAMARKKLQKMNKKAFIQNYREEKEKLQQAIRYAKKVLGKDSYLVDNLQFILFYRTHRSDIINKTAYLSIPRLKLLAREKHLFYQEILFCTADELLTDTIPSKLEIHQRMRGNAMISSDERILCIIGRGYMDLKEIFKEKQGDIIEISGQPASGGVAKGKVVKMILGSKNFSRVKEGDILVASMTTPEMLPVMKKAAAFVTDEGGITCHAAIIGREMKKPCIIATKIATKILKDGDVVEVNADKGMVKILRRSRD